MSKKENFIDKSYKKYSKLSKIDYDSDYKNFGVFSEMIKLEDSDNNTVIKPLCFKGITENKYGSVFVKCIFQTKNHSVNTFLIEPKVLEYITKYLLSNKNVAPHFSLYYSSEEALKNGVALFKHVPGVYNTFNIRNSVLVYFSEFIEDSQTLKKFLNKIFITETEENANKIAKQLIFQGLYTLYVLNKKIKLCHNDSHSENFFVKQIKPTDLIYNIFGKKIILKNCSYILKLTDFEFCSGSGLKNVFKNENIINEYADEQSQLMSIEENNFYDPHFFLTSIYESDFDDSITNFVEDIYKEYNIIDPVEGEDLLVEYRLNMETYNWEGKIPEVEEILNHTYFSDLIANPETITQTENKIEFTFNN